MYYGRSIEDHMGEFNKINLDLKNIEVKMDVVEQTLHSIN